MTAVGVDASVDELEAAAIAAADAEREAEAALVELLRERRSITASIAEAAVAGAAKEAERLQMRAWSMPKLVLDAEIAVRRARVLATRAALAEAEARHLQHKRAADAIAPELEDLKLRYEREANGASAYFGHSREASIRERDQLTDLFRFLHTNGRPRSEAGEAAR